MKYSMSSDAIYCAPCEFFDSQRDDAKDRTLERRLKSYLIRFKLSHRCTFFR